MAFNVQKCKTMHVGFNNPGYEYSMDGKKLETTEEERDLGLLYNVKEAEARKAVRQGRQDSPDGSRTDRPGLPFS